MREASVHTGRTRNTAPAAPGRLGNEHHHRNRPGHTTGAVPDPVPNPDYYHKVLGGDEAGTVARRLPAGLPTGWNGR
jgi:hypothetical protein